MNIRIVDNLRYLSIRENYIKTSIERIASGLRINSAKDDAVGISISTEISARLDGISVGIDNLNSAVLILRTAESALSVINSLLLRIRELILKSNNETSTELDKEIYKNEIYQFLQKMEDISKGVTYNGKKLLSYSHNDIFFLEGKEFLENISLTSAIPGEYRISIIDKGNAAKVALPFRTMRDVTVDTSLYSALEETLSQEYTKFLYIHSDSKTVEIELNISPYNGDTVGEVINKMNSSFIYNSMNLFTYYDPVGKQIVLASDEPGTRYDISISETNSIDGAKNFFDITEVIGLEFPGGRSSYNKLLSIEGAVKGTYIGGGTLVKNYFQTMEPIIFTFKGFAGNSITFSIPETYTLDSAALYIKNQLRTKLGIDIDVFFNEILDVFVFSYANPNERLEVYIENGIHKESYELINITENTLLGNVLDLQDELSISFIDTTGIVGSVAFDRFTTIEHLLEGINNLGIVAYLDNGIIGLDQTGRKSKIYEIIQTGSDSFNVKKRSVPLGYSPLESARDIVISLNGELYTSNCREFIIDEMRLTLSKDTLIESSQIYFRIISDPIIISLGKERIRLNLPIITLNSLGINNLKLDDIEETLGNIDKAIDKVSAERSNLKTTENVIRDIIQTNETYKINLTEAEARLLYADIVEEISKLSKDKLLYILASRLLEENTKVTKKTLSLLLDVKI